MDTRSGYNCPEGRRTANIFISYRREDSAAYAGRICDHLDACFGESRVFMDIEDIAPGQNFADKIEQTIANCSAVLVIIGPRWKEILSKRAEDQQQDYVCREIEAALKRNATLVPVLVGGASLNQLSGLPKPLADLSLREAAELRDVTFRDDLTRLAKALGATDPADAWLGAPPKKRTAWIVGAVATLLLLVAWIAVGPGRDYRARRATIQHLLSTAQTQTAQAEHEQAFHTYAELLRSAPDNRLARDGQVNAAMRWLQDFHVLVGEGQKAEDIAGPPLAEIMTVLDGGLARATGSRRADILAHLGWAHFLNQKLAAKEFGDVAERTLRQALSVDATNVYANAMLGNWLLQNGGSQEEALRHFETAVKTGKERPLVRTMQLGGLLSNDTGQVPAALIRLANEMRISGEPASSRSKRRILQNYNPNNGPEWLRQMLAALPPDDAWATYLWLDEDERAGGDVAGQRIRRDFVHAGILELSGKRDEALALFRKVQGDIKAQGYNGRIAEHVAAAIARLSRRPAA